MKRSLIETEEKDEGGKNQLFKSVFLESRLQLEKQQKEGERSLKPFCLPQKVNCEIFKNCRIDFVGKVFREFH